MLANSDQSIRCYAIFGPLFPLKRRSFEIGLRAATLLVHTIRNESLICLKAARTSETVSAPEGSQSVEKRGLNGIKLPDPRGVEIVPVSILRLLLHFFG